MRLSKQDLTVADISELTKRNFFKKTRKTSNCWYYTGSRVISTDKGGQTPCRVAYVLEYGYAPAGTMISHTCGKSIMCIKPSHLVCSERPLKLPVCCREGFCWSHVQKIRTGLLRGSSDAQIAGRYGKSLDAVASIRLNKSWKDNSYVPIRRRRFTDQQIRDIRKSVKTPYQLAKDYGTAYSTMWDIVHNTIYTDVT